MADDNKQRDGKRSLWQHSGGKLSFRGYRDVADQFKRSYRHARGPKRPGYTGKLFCVDHNHDDGSIRGLIHGKCNIALGLLGDTIAGVRKALAYLEHQQCDGDG